MADLNLKAVITADDRTHSTVSGFSNSLNSLGRTAALAGVAVAAAFATAAVAATVYAVKQATAYEQTKMALASMLGNVETAGKLLKDLSDFAARTPFQIKDVTDAGKQLLAFGFATKELIPQIGMLGDVASALNIPMNDMVYIYGTLRAQGRAYTRDLMQFAMRGIPIYDELAKVMGVSSNKVKDLTEKGEVGFPQVEKAFKNMTKAGGKFHDMMATQAKTFGGVMSNLKDNLTRVALQVVGISLMGDIRKGSLFYYLKIGAESLVKLLGDNQAVIIGFFNSIVVFSVRVVTEISKLVGKFNEWLTTTQNGQLVIMTFKVLIDQLIAAWKMVWEQIMKNKEAWTTLAKFLMGTFLASILILISLWTAVGVVLTGVINVVGWVINKFGELLGVAQSVAGAIHGAFIWAFSSIWSFVNQVGDWIIDKFNTVRAMLGLSIAPLSGGGLASWASAASAAARPKAMGGYVSAGNPYIVGEQGQELFVPSSSGRIIPNDKLGGGITVNFYGNLNNSRNLNVDEAGEKIARSIQLALMGAK